MSDKKKDTMQQFLTKQPHRLTVAKHTLGIHQLRIVARAVEALQPFMSVKVDYTKPSQDVWLEVAVGELTKGNNVKPLREALDGMMKKIVRIMHYIEEEATYLEIGTPLIKEYKYKHGDSTVKLQISGSLLPQMIDLAKGYTRYSLDVAFKTSSPNTFKLYQYIAHFRDKKIIQCNVDTLRQWLQLEDKYKMPAKIKEWVLDPAMRELKEKADVWFSINSRVTEGRKMIGWKFNIHTKEPLKAKKSPKKVQLLEQTNFKTKKGENCFRILTEYGFSGEQATDIVLWCEKNSKISSLGKLITEFANDLNKGKKNGIDDKVAYIAQVLRQNEIKV